MERIEILEGLTYTVDTNPIYPGNWNSNIRFWYETEDSYLFIDHVILAIDPREPIVFSEEFTYTPEQNYGTTIEVNETIRTYEIINENDEVEVVEEVLPPHLTIMFKSFDGADNLAEAIPFFLIDFNAA